MRISTHQAIVSLGACSALLSLACARSPEAPLLPPQASQAAASTLVNLCSANQAMFLRARLQGAIDAQLDWRGAELNCEGGARPGDRGLRAVFAGSLTSEVGNAKKSRRLRMIIGISLLDSAAGVAQALPTNLTLIIEGEGLTYATQGDQHCAVEQLDRRPLLTKPGFEALEVRGYCTRPAASFSGGPALLIPTFEFSSVIRSVD